MISEDKFGLRPIWDASLAIYKEVAKICERHGLRYYATDGTALGAVRHKGFIPWDDDFDISMPRPDYEKFKLIANKELPAHLRMFDYKDVPEFHLLFGKVQETCRDVVEDLERKVGHTLSNGVFIDIFPIDGYPSSVVKLVACRLVGFILSQALAFRFFEFKKRSWRGKLASGLGFFFAMLLPTLSKYQHFLSVYDRMLKWNAFDDCEYTGRSCSALTVFRRAPLPKSAWGRPTPLEFEDTTIMVPEDCDRHLRNEYYKWDYMVPPPKAQQHPTHDYGSHCPWWLGPTKKD